MLEIKNNCIVQIGTQMSQVHNPLLQTQSSTVHSLQKKKKDFKSCYLEWEPTTS